MMSPRTVNFELKRPADDTLLTKISKNQLATILAFYSEAKPSYAQIAEQLGIKEGTVKSRLNRGRAAIIKLRQEQETCPTNS